MIVRIIVLVFKLIPLLFLPLLLWSHPVTMTDWSVEIDGDALVVAFRGTWDDIILFANPIPDRDGGFSQQALGTARDDFARLLQGAVLLHKGMQGPVQRSNELIEFTAALPPPGFPLGVEQYPVVARIRCPLPGPFATCLFQFDLNAQERGISMTCFVTLRWPDQTLHRRIWGDGGLYPLIEADEDLVLGWTDPDGLDYFISTGLQPAQELRSFVTIRPQLIQHHILMPLMTWDSIASVTRVDPTQVSISERATLLQNIRQRVREDMSVEINGRPVRAQLHDISFFDRMAQQDDQLLAAGPLPFYQASIGIRLSYPCLQPPNSFQLSWPWFSPFADRVLTHIDAYGEQGYVDHVPVYPEQQWEGWPPQVDSLLPLPPVSPPVSVWLLAIAATLLVIALVTLLWFRAPIMALLLCSGSVLCWLQRGTASLPVDREQASTVTQTFIHNLYQTADFIEDTDRYDALSQIMTGPLLQQQFALLEASYIEQQQQGIFHDREHIEIHSIEYNGLSAAAWSCRVRWHVDAHVQHWGHGHHRRSNYLAQIQVRAINGQWRVHSFELRDKQHYRLP